MKRSKFLKAIGLIAVAPVAIAKAVESQEVVVDPIAEVPKNYGLQVARSIDSEWEAFLRQHPKTYQESFYSPRISKSLKLMKDLSFDGKLFTSKQDIKYQEWDQISVCDGDNQYSFLITKIVSKKSFLAKCFAIGGFVLKNEVDTVLIS